MKVSMELKHEICNCSSFYVQRGTCSLRSEKRVAGVIWLNKRFPREQKMS